MVISYLFTYPHPPPAQGMLSKCYLFLYPPLPHPWSRNTCMLPCHFCRIVGVQKSNLSFLAPTRSPRNANLRPVWTCLKLSIFIFWPQDDFRLTSGWLQDDFRTTSGRLQDDFRMTSGRLQDDFRTTSGRLQDDFRMTSGWLQDDFRITSESTQGALRSESDQREREQ